MIVLPPRYICVLMSPIPEVLRTAGKENISSLLRGWLITHPSFKIMIDLSPPTLQTRGLEHGDYVALRPPLISALSLSTALKAELCCSGANRGCTNFP